MENLESTLEEFEDYVTGATPAILIEILKNIDMSAGNKMNLIQDFLSVRILLWSQIGKKIFKLSS